MISDTNVKKGTRSQFSSTSWSGERGGGHAHPGVDAATRILATVLHATGTWQSSDRATSGTLEDRDAFTDPAGCVSE